MKQKPFVEDIETYAQDIVDTVREPLLMLDTTLRVRSANHAFYQTFQVSSEETENRLIYELGNGQWDIPALRTLLEDIIPTSSVFNDFELECTFPIIGRRVMLLNGRKLRPGSHTEFLVLAMEDVTERRRSEADLKAIETYAQNIVDTVREPLLILDTTLRVRSANRAFYQTFQVSLEETEDHLIYELGNGQWDIPDLRTLLEDIVPKSSVFNDFQLEHDFPAIGRRVMLLNARKLQAGHHGELLVLAMEDVTERRRSEEEVAKAKEAAETANRTKSLFLANMSHELRTPLNGIIGFAEFLFDGKPGTVNLKQKEYLGDILDSGKHLLQLINDVLDLAKVETGKMELNPEKFALGKAIEEVCAVSNPSLQKKGIRLEVYVAPGLGYVTLDQQKFKQVLYNLLSNAVKFTEDGGKVELHVAMHDATRFQLSVQDNGIGIKKEDFRRLFKEFEQMESGAARRYEGTGLGLALTRKIVESQGGEIGVESEVGKGTCFRVILPLIMAEGSRLNSTKNVQSFIS